LVERSAAGDKLAMQVLLPLGIPAATLKTRMFYARKKLAV
jgi:hypothetical protein